jgi:phosphoglycolate phosphatase
VLARHFELFAVLPSRAMPTPDALIFDLDGTLWDTTQTCARAWNRVVARLGIPYRPIEAAEVRAVAGKSHIEAIRAVFTDLDEPVIESICRDTAHEDNRAIAEEGGEIYPGVLEQVPLYRKRAPLMIVSNCQSGYIEVFLEQSKLQTQFVDIECWGNTGATKAANLASIMARNGVRRPLFVGDTEGDHEAARAAGAAFVHASYGFGAVTACDHRIDCFDELGRLL